MVSTLSQWLGSTFSPAKLFLLLSPSTASTLNEATVLGQTPEPSELPFPFFFLFSSFIHYMNNGHEL
jgi:hypothetical protein